MSITVLNIDEDFPGIYSILADSLAGGWTVSPDAGNKTINGLRINWKSVYSGNKKSFWFEESDTSPKAIYNLLNCAIAQTILIGSDTFMLGKQKYQIKYNKDWKVYVKNKWPHKFPNVVVKFFKDYALPFMAAFGIGCLLGLILKTLTEE